ncbi:MAG: xanthine dehydrogenase family protein [Thermoanaerobaculaceae bacterium]|nr:xanthine dehydrogenase family protein [Thermoanaerobaculaceae bacterium]MDI9623137.1 xanthine dehydrogenase family protein molybdopterin-binding subunit [Acidobacteriota bacterium]NLH10856.1 xanthine dehydrogenase family protein [Holophagae bacterium]HPW56556.1 xanthine dehydrogenase family protein molybdopterin-binding subunit [Thermoanaerobaculaceae bacterium]
MADPPARPVKGRRSKVEGGSARAADRGLHATPPGPLGGSHARPDASAKVAGLTRYVGDLALPGMLHAALATSRVASARIRSLDTRAALAVPDVVAVLTAADVPGQNSIGAVFGDQPLLVTDRVRMVGDRLALVAARTPEAAWIAARAVRADLEAIPGVHDPVAALDEGSPTVHDGGNLFRTLRVVKGKIDSRRSKATVIVEAEYHVGGQDHAYLEPQGCLAIPEGRDRLTIVASCQCPFYIQHAVAKVLGLPLAAVRVEQAPTGGGFGGKEDYPSEPAACAALLAWHTGRPVRLLFHRELDLQVTTKRHAMVVRHRWGADAKGKLQFAEVETFMDAGAYAGLSTVVAERANVSCIGPYAVPAVDVKTHVVYTNNLFGGAYRGFGAPQVTWAAEATIDKLARELGLDPLEMRRRNALDGMARTLCTGQKLVGPVLAREVLESATRMADWDAFRASRPQGSDRLRYGMGISLVLYGCNLHWGGQQLDRSSAVVILQPDGSVIVRVGLTDMGQGNLTAAQTIAAQALGVAPAAVQVWQPDTTTVGDSGPTVASRGSQMSGMAILDAVARLRTRLDPVAAELLGCAAEEVELGGGFATVRGQADRRVTVATVAAEMASRRLECIATGWYRTTPREFDSETGQGDPYEFYAMACHVARVAVDPELGLVTVEEVSAAHDVGRTIHRQALEGQIQGGIVQAMGWGVTEALHLRDGVLVNPNFTDYIIPTAADAPNINIAVLESDGPGGPYGAKGIGEPAFIPTAAAIRNAVCDALGLEIDTLPLTPPTVVAALGDRHPLAWVLEKSR